MFWNYWFRGVEARMDAMGNVILGMHDGWGQEQPVWLSLADRMHHLHVVGKSGTGKTTLLRNLILQDIEAGRGVGVIDPHGDLAHDLLDHIPRRHAERVVYFDPSDEEHAVSFNLLARVPHERRHLVASGIVAAFKGIFPDFFGPRMEYVFNAAVAALLDCDNVTLLGLHRMLTDEVYRSWVVAQVEDPMVRSFWEREFVSHDRRTRSEMVSPILNKVGPILMAPQVRNILGQIRNRIDARFIMDDGRIFIANLSKGKLGADKANLLGSFLVTQFQVSALSRADMPEDKRREFILCVDEFHSFITDSFAPLLSEARKYRLGLMLAHQYFDQLKPEILSAVMGNVGSLVAFRVGYRDAKVLEEAFGGAYAASHFSGLSNREMCAKILSDGRDIEPLTGRTLPPQGVRHGRRDAIIRRSREKYSSRRSAVEERIARWLRLGGR